MADAIIGYGSRFYMKATQAATVLTKVAEVTSVSIPDEQIADVEVTHYESPNRTREFIPGLTDAGEMAIEMNFVPGSTTDAMIVAAKADGLVRTMRVVTGVGATGQMYTFPGYVKGYERTLPNDDKLTATVTVRVAGAVIQAQATATPVTP